MKIYLFPLLFALFVVQSNARFDTLSIDTLVAGGSYGFKSKNPIKAGGGDMPAEIMTYLSHLKGSSGETVHYEKSGNGASYYGADKKYPRTGKEKTVTDRIRTEGAKQLGGICFDTYRYEKPKILKGYTWR